MAKERLFDLAETKGIFQVKGIVKGTTKDNFYQEKKTSTKKDMRIVNFGLEYEKGKMLYINLNGMERDEVFFNKKAEEKGGKSTTEKVAWAKRLMPYKKDFKLIGINLGLEKEANDKGKLVNKKVIMTEYDACKYIYENLKDDASVFIKGKLEYSEFVDDKGNTKKAVKLIPSQISLCGLDIDFEDEKLEITHDFKQTIIFKSIEKEIIDNNLTGRGIILADIVSYSSITEAEFICTDKGFCATLSKKIKPYNSLEVHGVIVSETPKEEVTVEDGWGDVSNIDKATSPTKREFIVTGGNPTSLDTTTYSEDKLSNARMKIINSKTENARYDGETSTDNTWGNSASSSSASDSDEEAW